MIMKALNSVFLSLVLAACAGPTLTYNYIGTGIDRLFAHAASDGDVTVVVGGAPPGWDARTAAALEAGNAYGPRARFVSRDKGPSGEAYIAVRFDPPASLSAGAVCDGEPGGGATSERRHLQIVLCSGGSAISVAELIVPGDADLAHALTQAMGLLVPPNDPQWDASGATPN
jgi:hypothetical protein